MTGPISGIPVGASRPAWLRVEAGKVAEFRAATGLPPDPGARFAPPTFPAVLEHFGPPVAGILADLGIDLGAVLHGEEQVHYPNGPLRVGEEFTGTVRLARVHRKQGRSGGLQLAEFEIELHGADGEPAVLITRTLVVLG